MAVFPTRRACSTMRENLPKEKSTLLCLAVTVFCLHLAVSEGTVPDLLPQQVREVGSAAGSASAEQGTPDLATLLVRQAAALGAPNLSHLRSHDRILATDLGPQRPHGQHPPTKKADAESAKDSGARLAKQRSPTDLIGLGPRRANGQIPPHIDLGPHRPSGQIPPNDSTRRLTPQDEGFSSGRDVGQQQLSNRKRRAVDIGPHRPSGQIPPQPNMGSQNRKDRIPSVVSSASSLNDFGAHGEGMAMRTSPDRDIGPQRPNGQHPPPSDIGPQRPNGQHPPLSDTDLQRQSREIPWILRAFFPNNFNAPSESASQENTGDRSLFDDDIGPQRPNGQHPPPSDIGPQRPNGQNPPQDDSGLQRTNGQHLPPSDIGPQRPNGQHPPQDDSGLQRSNEKHLPPSDIGPQRPNGQHPPPSDIGPQRPNGQNPPQDDSGLQRSNRQHLPPSDIGPQRPNGQHPPPSDIGPQRTNGQNPPQDDSGRKRSNGQHLPPTDIGPQRPNGQHPPPSDIGPQRPNGQHPPQDDSRLQRSNEKHLPPSDIGPQRPNGQHPPPSDIGPQRPNGQNPPQDDSGLQRSNRQHLPPSDIGPQRPNEQHPPSSDIGPQRPNGQVPPVMRGLSFTNSYESNDVFSERKSDGAETLTSNNERQRPIEEYSYSQQGERNRRKIDVGSHRLDGQVLTKFHGQTESPVTERLNFYSSGETLVQNDFSENDIEISPYSRVSYESFSELDKLNDKRFIDASVQHGDLGHHRLSAQNPSQNEPSRIVLLDARPADLGPHRPSGATDPNGIPQIPTDLGPHRPGGQNPPGHTSSSPVGDLGPHRPNGATDPNGLPVPPADLGPQRPAGQNQPSASELKPVLSDPPTDLGPHRPSGATDPNGIPQIPTDLGPHRPGGQNPPGHTSSSPVGDLGPHRPNGATDPNGLPVPPADLGPQRPAGQNQSSESELKPVLSDPPTDLGPHRPSGATDPNGIPQIPTDLGPHRPGGQNPPGHSSSSPVGDFGPHRPNGATDPNGLPVPPADLGPQRPAGQNQPSESKLKRVLSDPPTDLGPHRPSGATDPNGIPQIPTDLGPHRPGGQNPPGHTSSSPVGDLGPHRPNGATDPNGLPVPPADLGPQRPAGQIPPTTGNTQRVISNAAMVEVIPSRPTGAMHSNGGLDLGPHRPAGQSLSSGNEPSRVEAVPVAPIDLGPHRPTGPTDPNIKPESSESDPYQEPYQVYWNVPTFMCHKHGYKFTNLTGEYGIVQNPDDKFRGPRVTILYDPGLFPAVLENQKESKVLRNGGVPQEGDLQAHLKALEESIEEQVPKDFDGLGIIDFEAWRPVWAQNWGALSIYRTVSIDVERRRDPGATRKALESRARARFESAARVYFEATLQLANELRPRGRWGFYGFPHCFNQVPTRPADYSCAPQHQHQNDKIDWLWKASSALYPSVYLTKRNKTAEDELAFVTGRLTEAQRVSHGSPVYAYAWYRYHDTGAFLSENDLWSSLNVPRKLNLAGTILWGSSSDLNSREKCARFSEALEESLGPAVARATGRLASSKTSFVGSPLVIVAQ